MGKWTATLELPPYVYKLQTYMQAHMQRGDPSEEQDARHEQDARDGPFSHPLSRDGHHAREPLVQLAPILRVAPAESMVVDPGDVALGDIGTDQSPPILPTGSRAGLAIARSCGAEAVWHGPSVASPWHALRAKHRLA